MSWNLAYYNDNDPFCCRWLENLIGEGLIPNGYVDNRSIADVHPDDLTGFEQCHFFAGLGGWTRALRLAGWPDTRPIWTGSCPCQPFSVAGKRKGVADKRHLWPDFHRLIRAARPPVIMGEQVSGKAGYGWLDGVVADLEREAYTVRAVDIPACAVNAPHQRNRLYWVADTDHAERRADKPRGHDNNREATGRQQGDGDPEESGAADSQLAYAALDGRRERRAEHEVRGRGDATTGASGNFWHDYTLVGPDPQGKYRHAKPGVRLLAHGIPARVGRLRAYGNAIVSQVAAEVIRAYMETEK